jgi:hypothetical protein
MDGSMEKKADGAEEDAGENYSQSKSKTMRSDRV